MDNEKVIYKDMSYKIVGFALQVHNELGYGFLEKGYENAMMVLFRRDGMKALQQVPITVRFSNEIVGDYFADILVDDMIVLELKSIEKINNAHRAQALNYLKATNKQLAIILNFGKEKLEYERLVYQPSFNIRVI
jgi:GxxExxY protein